MLPSARVYSSSEHQGLLLYPAQLMSATDANGLTTWLTAIGGAVHAAVQLSVSVNSGSRGVLASGTFRHGEALISVPPAGCLHVAADPLTAEHEVRVPQLPRQPFILGV